MASKPCPFCGETDQDALAYKRSGCPCIYCMTCGAEGPSADNEADATTKWNTRVDPQRDRLVKALKKIRDNPEQHFTYYNRPEEGHSCYFRKGRAKAFQEIAELARDVLEEEKL